MPNEVDHIEESNMSNGKPSNEVIWRNNDELAAHKDFEAFLKEKFPKEAAILKGSGMGRRNFLKLMGASLTLAGFGLQGCTTADAPNEKIIPYVRTPEEVIPGRPVFFASAVSLGGFATGVIIETHEGRPTRLDGNPEHPGSLGSSNPFVQASILELYNPERSVFVRQADENGNRISSWEEFVAAVGDALARLEDGSQLRILTETVTSPTLASQMETLLEMYPGASWHQYEPVARDNVLAGANMAFGEPANTMYDFSSAQVVVSLDSDFMNAMPGSLRYARDFMAGRKVRPGAGVTEMNRLYAVESTPTPTGAVADHRLTMRTSEVEAFARALADALGVEGGAAASGDAWSSEAFDAIVADLEANAGASVVVAGDEASPVVHALVHAINASLGNVGSTVMYTEPIEVSPINQHESLQTLVDDMAAGDVQALFIMGGNPVYNAPADIDFAGALANVPFSAHLALYNDETSLASTWHVPETHFIEQWGDARAYDGTVSVIQPPIGPLLDTVRSPVEMMALLTGDERRSYDIVREYWEAEFEGDDFNGAWRATLHSGVLADSAAEIIEPTLVGSLADDVESNAVGASEGLELVIRPDAAVWDGRFAANAWLHELPKPLTKITWDMAALMSAATADELDVESEDLVELGFGGNTMMAPVYVMPTHADGTVTVTLGYGRGIGADIDANMSFNAYDVRTSAAPWGGSGVTVTRRGRYDLARSQIDIDESSPIETHSPVRHAPISQLLADPNEITYNYLLTEPSLLPEYDYSGGYKWGMSIDLTSCMGCNACVIACQAENNIPVVGKEQVIKGREMHWLRIDEYHAEGEDQTYFQPVPCMQCENAPCEQVCPVQATVHSDEGINQMVYNRCIGTRYCSANCPYSVRKFNFLDYIDESALLAEQRNPNVSVRARGIMEKCTYCVQRIKSARIDAQVDNRRISDGEVMPACAVACPTEAIIFGDLNDENSRIAQIKQEPHDYGVLEELGTVPRTTYLARITNPNDALEEEA